MGEYAWAEAAWRVLMEMIEDTQKKLCEGPISKVQLNSFCVLIQVILQYAMLYRLFESYDMKCGMNLNIKIVRN